MASKRGQGGPHPRREPRIPGELSLERLEEVFRDCADFNKRHMFLHGDRDRGVTVCYIDGMARTERLNDYVLKPLARNPVLASAPREEIGRASGRERVLCSV